MTREQIGKAISENTPITVGMAIGIVSAAVIITTWGRSLEARVDGHVAEDDKRVAALAAEIKATEIINRRIDRRLMRIEQKMGIYSRDPEERDQ